MEAEETIRQPVKPIRQRRAVDLATENLRNAILSGRFPPESLLPPERELATTVGVNRLTLRAALSHLEAQGLVRARQGQGVRVLDYRTTGIFDLVMHLEQTDLIEHLAPLKRTLIAEAVALACRTASAEEIEVLEEMSCRPIDRQDPEAALAADLEFKRAVVESSHNIALVLLYNTLDRFSRQRADLGLKLQKYRVPVRASYRAVVKAIKSDDPHWARESVRQTLQHLDDAPLD